jgi:hypothetical protein
MRCKRCDGLMVVDHLIDLECSGELWLSVWRCANCGNVMDTNPPTSSPVASRPVRSRHVPHPVFPRGKE